MTITALLKQERYFREHASEIANGDASVLDELFTQFTPSLTREQLVANAKAHLEATAHADTVYNEYGSLSASEIVKVSVAQQDEGKAALLSDLKTVNDKALSTYETFQELSKQRAELALNIYEAGVSQAEIADTLGVARQRAYSLINQGRKAREKQQ